MKLIIKNHIENKKYKHYCTLSNNLPSFRDSYDYLIEKFGSFASIEALKVMPEEKNFVKDSFVFRISISNRAERRIIEKEFKKEMTWLDFSKIKEFVEQEDEKIKYSENHLDKAVFKKV